MISTRLRAPLLLGAICLAWVALGAAQDPAPSGNENEKTLYANSQETFNPGFALGDVAVAEPEIADYKVLAGRREMLLYGKTPGTTTLTLWDQKRVQRAVITITVISREDQQAEKDLTELVADFPSVKVRRVKGKLVLTGVVQTKNDLEAIQKIAETAEATSLVRLSGMVQPPPGPGATNTPSGPTDAPKYNENGDPLPPPATIHYEFDVLEASVNYSSGSYATGVEPAGRSLFKKSVAAGTGGNVEVFVPGSAILPPDKATTKPKKGAPVPPPIGIKLTLQPSELAEDGSFTTVVLIETNVPVDGAPDPSIMRRARWEVPVAQQEAFGLAGAELLAVPMIEQHQSKLGRAMGVAGVVGGLPGVSSAPGVGYVGAVPYYSKEKKTQLLAIFHPRVEKGIKK
jgi:hypothetical protein